MAPTNSSGANSNKQTSSPSGRTDRTTPSQVQSSTSRRSPTLLDAALASDIASMRIRTSPRQGPTTRSMTGSLKRKDPEPEPEPIVSARSSTKKRRIEKAAASPDPSVRSPWEPTVRTKLDVDVLDLDKSYVDTINTTAAPEPERPPRQKRWKHSGDQPLIDVKKLPKGWNTREPDLDPNGIEAQIERCEERIEDNIMPHAFENRLKEYQKLKAEREEMARGEPPDLGWDVVQRINCLKNMKTELERKGDERDQLSNIEALLEAYRSRKLQWTGLVTYWSKGEQLCQPRPFNWDEFEAINRKHHGHKNFWVEGYLGPGPELHHVGMLFELARGSLFMHTVRVAVRLPAYEWWDEFEFLHDTGASLMSLFETDLATLMDPFRPPFYPEVPVLGQARNQTANGIITKDVIEVEVTLLDTKGRRMSQWLRVPCALKDRGQTTTRVDGPWIRHVLWNAYAPDGKNLFHVANSKSSLNLPRRCPDAKRLAAITSAPLQPPTNPTSKRPGPPAQDLMYAGPKAMPRAAPRAPT